MQELFFSEHSIHYRVNELQSGRPTLVFIHGLSGSSSAWKNYEEKFEKKYNILTFDLRGHGKSEKLGKYRDYEIKHFVEDVHKLVRHLNIENFVLISHSFGTFIALEFLVEYQNEVASAVFLSPGFSVHKRKLARLIQPLLWLSYFFAFIPFSSRSGGHIDYTRYQNTGDWNIRRMIADIRNTSLRVYLYCTKQSYSFDREDFLNQIKIPVLIVHGKDDTIVPVENAIVMAEKIKNSRLIIIPGADHILVLNNEAEVSKAIEDFVNA